MNDAETAQARLKALYSSFKTWRAVAEHLIVQNDLRDKPDSLTSQLCRMSRQTSLTRRQINKILGHKTRVRISIDASEQLRERFNELADREDLTRSEMLRALIVFWDIAREKGDEP